MGVYPMWMNGRNKTSIMIPGGGGAGPAEPSSGFSAGGGGAEHWDRHPIVKLHLMSMHQSDSINKIKVKAKLLGVKDED